MLILSDALWGLRELLDTNPRLIESSLTPIIQTCARILGDEVIKSSLLHNSIYPLYRMPKSGKLS